MVLEMSVLDDAERRAVQAARWGVEVAVRLDARSPLQAFGRQVRFALRVVPQAVALHDANALRFVPMARARAIASWRTAPPPTDLYVGQAIFSPEEGGKRWWFHTHGLQRAGLPDVEILRVPHRLVTAASLTVRAFVRAHLGRPVPTTGRSDQVFPGHAIAWVPALEAAATLGSRFPGNLAERGGSLGHDGRRIALVEAGREGRALRPPIALLRWFDRGEGVVSVPEQESERAARLARERWDVFAGLFARHGSERAWEFAVCAGVERPGGGTEYLWWSVEEVRARRMRARLASDPCPGIDVERGALRWYAVDDLVDWAVHAPDVSVDPSTVRVPA
jgi:hypothetical protein